jgi:hypothetical protein
VGEIMSDSFHVLVGTVQEQARLLHQLLQPYAAAAGAAPGAGIDQAQLAAALQSLMAQPAGIPSAPAPAAAAAAAPGTVRHLDTYQDYTNILQETKDTGKAVVIGSSLSAVSVCFPCDFAHFRSAFGQTLLRRGVVLAKWSPQSSSRWPRGIRV